MRHLIVFAAVAALSACSAQEEAEPSRAELTAPAATTWRQAVYQAGEEGPEPFVRALYDRYGGDLPAGDAPAPGQDPIYNRMLNAMIGADFMQAGEDEVPHLNEDPICGCQDGEIALTSVTVTETAAGRADAVVQFTRDGAPVTQTLKLEREGPMWRVADVIPEGERALTERLLEVIE